MTPFLSNYWTEAATGGVLSKKVFLKIFAKFTGKHLCENTCRRPATLLKKRLWRRCFPVNFAKFLRTLFYIEQLRWLLLLFETWIFGGNSETQKTNLITSWSISSKILPPILCPYLLNSRIHTICNTICCNTRVMNFYDCNIYWKLKSYC